MKPYCECPKFTSRTMSKRAKLAYIAHYAHQFVTFRHVTGGVLERSRYGFHFFTISKRILSL
ncbi:MAG: hypothetical protein HQL68_01440 [Magnetococcales bacterium]|nr:hypothetical protein [Magnetococcales bacterium]